jgi:hypothetical protein
VIPSFSTTLKEFLSSGLEPNRCSGAMMCGQTRNKGAFLADAALTGGQL